MVGTPPERDREAALKHAVLSLTAARGPEKSICPSEAARAVAPDAWRALMPLTRDVAATLATQGLIVVTQRGRAVDPLAVGGPIRLRAPRR